MSTVVLLFSESAHADQRVLLRRLLEADGIAVWELPLDSGGSAAKRLHDAIGDGLCDGAICLSDAADERPLPLLQSLPIGLPKVIVATRITGSTRHLVSGTDIFLLAAQADELPDAPPALLKNAAAIVSGAIKNARRIKELSDEGNDRPLIGVSMFGVTTGGVMKIVDRLESRGFETIVFHATGSGGDSLEGMIRSGLISGIIDLTPAEISGTLFHRSNASKDRMQAAARMGIPTVAVPGALDVLIFTEPGGVPERYKDPERQFIVHSPTNTCGRTLPDELLEAGRYFVEQVNRSTGPVAVLLPLKGLDAFNAPEGQWPEMDQVNGLFDEIRTTLRKDIPLIEVPAHINDEAFATAVTETFLRLFSAVK